MNNFDSNTLSVFYGSYSKKIFSHCSMQLANGWKFGCDLQVQLLLVTITKRPYLFKKFKRVDHDWNITNIQKMLKIWKVDNYENCNLRLSNIFM